MAHSLSKSIFSTLALLVIAISGCLFSINTTKASIPSCTITQNGVSVKDSVVDVSSKKATRRVPVDIKFGYTLKQTEIYSSYTWDETIDGVLQNTSPYTTATSTQKGANTGNQFVERLGRVFPDEVNKLRLKLKINYSTLDNNTYNSHYYTNGCSFSYKDHLPDAAKSTFTASTPVLGKSTLTATVVDSSGVPVANTTVEVSNIGKKNGTPTFSPASAKTNNLGVATIVASANYSGTDTYVAVLKDFPSTYGGYLEISKQLLVTFTGGSAAPAKSSQLGNLGQTANTEVVKSPASLFTPSSPATPDAAAKAAADKAAADAAAKAAADAAAKTAADKVTADAAAQAALDKAAADAAASKAALAQKAADDAAAAAAADPSNTEAAATAATTAAAAKEAEKVATEATDKAATSTTAATPGAASTLKNGPDILNCKATAKVLYFVDDAPTSDSLGLACSLTYPASVWVGVYNKTFNPKTEDNSANEIKAIWTTKAMKVGDFYVSWNGLDNADQAPALDDYVIVAGAKLDDKYKTDFSVQKFKIVNSVDQKTEVQTSNEAQNNIAGKTETTVLHGAPDAKKEVVPSKCPGTNYPNDVAGNAAEAFIKSAYDRCLVRGYEDGSFRPEAGLTRAEATKIVLLAKSKLAHKGCYTNDCGSPFKDLDAWQGPWVRAAADLKIVSGITPNKFFPNRALSRAEAAALTVKAFGFSPYQGCFTANCGAGHPDNFFRDIFNNWEGPYLRVLWDKGLINTLEKNKFFPEREITRADFIKTIMTITGK